MNNVDLCVIIPAYNEERNILQTIQNTAEYLLSTPIQFELIVVDDGSVDGTSELIQQQIDTGLSYRLRLIINENNRGKGYSVKRGVMETDAAVILFMDADLAYELETIERMYQTVKNGFQVVLGSRNLPESKMNADVPLMRFISGKVYSWIIQILMFRGISDTQCGIKCFDGLISKTLFKNSHIDDFGFDVELIYIAKKKEFSVISIPVTMIKHRKESRVNIFSDSIKMFFDLFLIRWNDIRGRYLD